jgi:hypothetical protein
MKSRGFASVTVAALAVSAFLFLGSPKAYAHCDGLDGPVVAAGRGALESGNVNRALIWVHADQEAELRQAFARAVALRKSGPQARELADTWFFETLVRLHRAGEGAPYSGLKPAERDLGPAIPAADRAFETGKLRDLEELVIDAVREGLHGQFKEVMEKKGAGLDDVTAGRALVGSYVEYVHWVERLYEAAGAHAD